MIYLTMDTSGVSNRGRTNAAFKALKRLVDAKKISIHVPYVVKREIETQEYNKYIEKFEAALSTINKLDKFIKTDDIKQRISDISAQLVAMEAVIKQDARDNSKLWFEMLNVDFCTVDGAQAEQAFEAYFTGAPPLTACKNREDIPDSFVCRGIEKIKEKSKHLHLIVNDIKIVNTFQDNPDFTLHKDIFEFIGNEHIQNEIKKLDTDTILEGKARQFFNTAKVIEKIKEDDSEIVEYLSSNIGEEIHGNTISDYSIPDDNHEATITGYGDGENIKLDLTDIIYYGEDQFGINYELEVEVYAEYFIFKSDYHAMLDDDRTCSVSDWNDHYYAAEENFTVKVTGVVSIKLNTENLDKKKKIAEIVNDYHDDNSKDDIWEYVDINLEDCLEGCLADAEIKIESADIALENKTQIEY